MRNWQDTRLQETEKLNRVLSLIYITKVAVITVGMGILYFFKNLWEVFKETDWCSILILRYVPRSKNQSLHFVGDTN